MKGTTAGALIPEIVRRGFQDLLETEVSAAIGAQLHEHRPDERSTHRNGYRERVLPGQWHRRAGFSAADGPIPQGFAPENPWCRQGLRHQGFRG